MRVATLIVCSCCALASTDALARTFSFPHVLETSGRLSYNNGPDGTFGQGSGMTGCESFGPGENGEFTYLLSSPIVTPYTDSLGRSFVLSLEFFSAQCRPEGNQFRFEAFGSSSISSFNGESVSISGPGLELSTLVSTADPLGEVQMSLDMPLMHFVGEDGSGRRISVDFDAGSLRLVPSPISAALLGLGAMLKGLVRGRRK